MKESNETTTCLYRSDRVRKDHPRIAFRGALDELHAQNICCQLVLRREGEFDAERKLGYLPVVIRALMSAEYDGRAFDLSAFNDLDWESLHEISHRPKQHLGIDHPIVHAEFGESVAALNLLRTKARECERLAVTAFDAQREDLVHALNRMSSAIYVLICEICTKKEATCR